LKRALREESGNGSGICPTSLSIISPFVRWSGILRGSEEEAAQSYTGREVCKTSLPARRISLGQRQRKLPKIESGGGP